VRRETLAYLYARAPGGVKAGGAYLELGSQ